MNFSHEKNTGKNFTGIAVVIVLHLFVGWAAVSGLGTRVVAKMAEVVETQIIEEAKPLPPPDVPPPPPPPEMKAPPPPFVPPVEVNVQQPPPPSQMAAVTNVKPATTELIRALPQPSAPPTTTPAKSVTVAAVADFNTCAKPEYPKASMRNEETGTVTLSFLIGTDGRVMDQKVTKSSGSRDLDKAAVNGISKCRFKPGMVDGVPTQNWMQMQYVWTLEN
ncbi:energy transducer TonB [Massilia glaciei]|uniref:Energy transducer TonB n=1 Tax=Massilia glaciei TaxID=1524097 RepID=A0A2U2HHT2_9BURK|nr:energy transducer TonB [Massilia glaciei]PWF45468.1 energy transducer TonB [Massilia glaciei]